MKTPVCSQAELLVTFRVKDGEYEEILLAVQESGLGEIEFAELLVSRLLDSHKPGAPLYALYRGEKLKLVSMRLRGEQLDMLRRIADLEEVSIEVLCYTALRDYLYLRRCRGRRAAKLGLQLLAVLMLGCACTPQAQPSPVAGRFDFSYEVKGGRKIGLMQVFSDSRSTYLHLPAAGGRGVMRVQQQKGGQALSARAEGDYLVINGLYPVLQVRSKSGEAVVTRVAETPVGQSGRPLCRHAFALLCRLWGKE